MKFLKIKTFTSTVTIRHLVSPRQSNAEPPGNHDIYKSNWSQRVSITVRVRSSIWAGAPKKRDEWRKLRRWNASGTDGCDQRRTLFLYYFQEHIPHIRGNCGNVYAGKENSDKRGTCLHSSLLLPFLRSCIRCFLGVWEMGFKHHLQRRAGCFCLISTTVSQSSRLIASAGLKMLVFT